MARSEVIILSVSQGRGHGAEQALAALLASVPEADRGRISICSPLDSALHGFAMDAGYRWIEWLASRDCFRENARACRHLHRADNLAGYDVIFA